MEPVVTEYQGHALTCPVCGEVTHQTIPRQLFRHSVGTLMADFAKWGAAAAEALGIGAGTFLRLYHDNIRRSMRRPSRRTRSPSRRARRGTSVSRQLERIRRLYAIERDLPPLFPPADEPRGQEQRRQREEECRAARRRQAEPMLAELQGWLEEQRPQTLPKSELGQAIGYALNNWEALGRYLEQGYLVIDNNLSERTLRVIALGRNNWGVFGSETGGRTAAVLYTVAGTCKHLSIDPFAYLREALPGLFALGENPTCAQLLPWLPDRWLLNRARDAPAERVHAG